MKIYTKTGDKGTTSLLGGTRVSKSHKRIESYGAVDELNSHTGLLRDYMSKTLSIDFILDIQQKLFIIGSNLADNSGNNKFNLPKVRIEDIEAIEREIDALDSNLPPLKNFILPGGHQAVSQAHICRCVCRRAEREVVKLGDLEEVDITIVSFLNRLSDYFFTLSRALSHELQVQEIPWNPK